MKKLFLILLLFITGNIWLPGHAGNVPAYELSGFCSDTRLDILSFTGLANIKGSGEDKFENYRSLNICNFNPSGSFLYNTSCKILLTTANIIKSGLNNNIYPSFVAGFYSRRAPPLNPATIV